MAKKNNSNQDSGMKKWDHKKGAMNSGGVYGLGMIGALVYYLQHAQSFSEGFFGVIKAFFWPAFLVYKLLEVLKF